MKLYYKPGACSLASHIVLQEIGNRFEIEKVDTDTGLTETGADYLQVNAKGYVPALDLDGAGVLTEGPAILQFLADSAPQAQLAPPIGTVERAKMLEQLTFVSSELHKAFSPLFSAQASETDQERAKEQVAVKFTQVEAVLADARETLVPGHFGIADIYLFVVANWANFKGIALSDWPYLQAFLARVSKRASVERAMKAEGLLA
ncbi:glutathione S-transferase C-terminal domain-containing protein [Cognatishimia sp. WU-CL00825]|uniref:glutathione transferase GstA n=1 Tax=Cognatishimia sp. WU-CL00825 TaxID=3127658 RepID=UPI003102CFC3